MNLLTYNKSGLTAGVSYRFKVTALNYIGEGAESPIGTIIAATVPDQILQAPTYVSSTLTSVTVTWLAPDNGGSAITGYKVLMNGGGSSTVFTDITSSGTLNNTTRTFTTPTSLTTGTTYQFKVVATNAVGDSVESPQSLNIMAAIVPTVPLNLAKFAATSSSITVSWVAPTNTGGTPLTGYNVYCNGGGASATFTQIVTVSGTTLQY
jgi:hypothetical protein